MTDKCLKVSHLLGSLVKSVHNAPEGSGIVDSIPSGSEILVFVQK